MKLPQIPPFKLEYFNDDAIVDGRFSQLFKGPFGTATFISESDDGVSLHWFEMDKTMDLLFKKDSKILKSLIPEERKFNWDHGYMFISSDCIAGIMKNIDHHRALDRYYVGPGEFVSNLFRGPFNSDIFIQETADGDMVHWFEFNATIGCFFVKEVAEQLMRLRIEKIKHPTNDHLEFISFQTLIEIFNAIDYKQIKTWFSVAMDTLPYDVHYKLIRDYFFQATDCWTLSAVFGPMEMFCKNKHDVLKRKHPHCVAKLKTDFVIDNVSLNINDYHPQLAERMDVLANYYGLELVDGKNWLYCNKRVRRYPPRSWKRKSILTIHDIAHIDSVYHLKAFGPDRGQLEDVIRQGGIECAKFLIETFNITTIDSSMMIAALESKNWELCRHLFDMSRMISIDFLDAVLYTENYDLITHVYEKTGMIWRLE